MPESTSPRIRFAVPPRPLDATFDLDALTSDGDLVWLHKADEAFGLSQAFAAVLPDWRRRPGRHPMRLLV